MDTLNEFSNQFGIGVVGLSSPITDYRRDAVAEAIQSLRERGFYVVVGESALASRGHKTATIADRVRDVHAMFQDRLVNIILNTTGGFNSNELLEFLDYEMIARHPKWFVGYSDITAVNLALYAKARLHTVNGQMLVDYAFDRECLHRLFAVLQWGKSSFDNPKFLWDGPWEMHEKSQWECEPIECMPRRRTEATGTTVAGNLSTFNLLLGTPYLPRIQDAVYFFEYDMEEKHGLPSLERYLWQIRLAGLFSDARALVFGSLQKSVKEEERLYAGRNIREILAEVTQGFDFPVLYNAGFGHSYPSWPIINGQRVRISDNTIKSEAPVTTSPLS